MTTRETTTTKGQTMTVTVQAGITLTDAAAWAVNERLARPINYRVDVVPSTTYPDRYDVVHVYQ